MTKTRKCIVGIAGGSGSGKTTFAHRVLKESAGSGIAGQIVSLDNYYRSLGHMSIDDRRSYNFDHPEAIDFALAARDLQKLSVGEPVHQPLYDFASYTRSKETVAVKPTPLILVEGLYALYPRELLKFYDYRIFISTGIATAVLRRLERDIEDRGRDVHWSKHQILTTVLPMYETYVKPTQRNAHFSVNWDGEEIPDKATEGLVRMVKDFFS